MSKQSTEIKKTTYRCPVCGSIMVHAANEAYYPKNYYCSEIAECGYRGWTRDTLLDRQQEVGIAKANTPNVLECKQAGPKTRMERLPLNSGGHEIVEINLTPLQQWMQEKYPRTYQELLDNPAGSTTDAEIRAKWPDMPTEWFNQAHDKAMQPKAPVELTAFKTWLQEHYPIIYAGINPTVGTTDHEIRAMHPTLYNEWVEEVGTTLDETAAEFLRKTEVMHPMGQQLTPLQIWIRHNYLGIYEASKLEELTDAEISEANWELVNKWEQSKQPELMTSSHNEEGCMEHGDQNCAVCRAPEEEAEPDLDTELKLLACVECADYKGKRDHSFVQTFGPCTACTCNPTHKSNFKSKKVEYNVSMTVQMQVGVLYVKAADADAARVAAQARLEEYIDRFNDRTEGVQFQKTEIINTREEVINEGKRTCAECGCYTLMGCVPSCCLEGAGCKPLPKDHSEPPEWCIGRVKDEMFDLHEEVS